MPRRAFRCVVNLTLNEVTAPGVWLPSREDVYLSVSLFGQYQTTRLLLSVFPLAVYEKFRFEKTYYTAVDLAEVTDYLKDEVVIIELVQLSEYSDGVVRLGSYSSRAGELLQPCPPYAASCLSTDHEILLSRTIAFGGIAPKLSFSTRTFIKESLSPELDALEDALEEEKERRFFRKMHRVPTRRARSAKSKTSSRHNISVLSYDPNEDDPPPRYRQHTQSSLSHCRSISVPTAFADIDLSDNADLKPVFAVRRLDQGLTSRVPGGTQGNRNTNATRKDKNKEKSKSESKSKKQKKKKEKESSKSSDHLDLGHSSLKQHSHGNKLVHGSLYHQPLHLLLSDDEDDGFYIARRRPRSASASVPYRSRYRSYPPQLDNFYNMPPERIRLMPYYETDMYDWEL